MSTAVYIAPEIAALRSLYAPVLDARTRALPIRDHLAAQADCLLAAHRVGDAAANFQIASWHPRLVGAQANVIAAAAFDLNDARLTIAREHGYADWTQVEQEGVAVLDAAFESAVDAELNGDAAGLTRMLAAAPDLIARRSGYGHRAGLLHYMAANGVESWRQVTPANADALVALLVSAGADVNAVAPIYGGARPLGLVVSSAHPKAAGKADAMAAALSAAGAH